MGAQEVTPALNGDMRQRVGVDSAARAWQPSPSGTVWRKRLHRVGPAESGQVTSIVRYDRGATFPVHDHPEGEEILVLQGIFSDEHGDWPAGTYLLNPEGFCHAPFSRQGCVLFVKLRQYAGTGRRHVVLDTNALPWEPTSQGSIEAKTLYADESFADTTRLERWIPGAVPGELHHATGAEMLVLDGSFQDEHGAYPKGSWLRLPAGAHHRPVSAGGCVLYVKRGALASLRSQPGGTLDGRVDNRQRQSED